MRFWEIDFFRGSAILLMIISNLITDLVFFQIYQVSFEWVLFPRIVVSMFIFIAGASLYISYCQRKEEMHFFFRGAKIFFYGILITITTLMLVPSHYIFFGILHFIGAAIIIGYFLIPRRTVMVFVAGLSIVFYLAAPKITVPLFTSTFKISLDYVPLAPWLAVFIAGILVSQKFYRQGKRTFSIRKPTKIEKGLCLAGRNSLKIYMLHQPVIVFILAILYPAHIFSVLAV